MKFRQPEICNISHGSIPIPEKADHNMANHNVIMCDDHSKYLPDILDIAKKNYERFFDMKPGIITQKQISRLSLTVAGWAACDVRDYQSVVQDREHREAQEKSV